MYKLKKEKSADIDVREKKRKRMFEMRKMIEKVSRCGGVVCVMMNDKC